MRNKTKVFLAILSMALSFALSFACTVYASPLVDHDRQTADIANEPETARRRKGALSPSFRMSITARSWSQRLSRCAMMEPNGQKRPERRRMQTL